MTTRLTTDLLSESSSKLYRFQDKLEWLKVIDQNFQLHEKIKVFEAVVWFPYLQELVNSTNSRGMSGYCRDIKIMTWCCAGRCLIQLERNGHRITLITADDEEPWNRELAHVAPGMGPMGLQSIDAEFLEALIMLYETTRYGKDITLAFDDNVGI